jgi:hypothetical protein
VVGVQLFIRVKNGKKFGGNQDTRAKLLMARQRLADSYVRRRRLGGYPISWCAGPRLGGGLHFQAVFEAREQLHARVMQRLVLHPSEYLLVV